MALVAQQASFPQISTIGPSGFAEASYNDGSTSPLGSSIGAGEPASDAARSLSRLPALQKRRPQMKVVFQLELKELQGEVRDLQAELNMLVGESQQKQARLKAMIEGDRSETLSSPPPQIGTPAYLQQQLWLVEQASAAERKYEASLKTLMNQAISDERAQEREKLLIEREMKATMRELRLARDRGNKIGRLKDQSRAQLDHLQQQSARSERERDAQLGELSAVRSTVLEQQLRMQERRKRRDMFKAEAAGDMDEDGEAALLDSLREMKLQQGISRQEAMKAASKERALREEWTRIMEVSGEEEETAIIRRFESQRDNVTQLQGKLAVVEEKMTQLNSELLVRVDERQRLWSERGSGPAGNMMEQVAMFQEQLRQQKVDVDRRVKKVTKIELIMHESKDKLWHLCTRLTQVPALAHVVGPGITQSSMESNLINVRTLLPELDRYLPVLMRLFASVVPADERYSSIEMSPPWSPPVKRPFFDSYKDATRGGINQDEPTEMSVGNVRAMLPDDVEHDNEDNDSASKSGDATKGASNHADVEQVRKQAGIEASMDRTGQTDGKRKGKSSRRLSKGRDKDRQTNRRVSRNGPVRLRPPKTLSPIKTRTR